MLTAVCLLGIAGWSQAARSKNAGHLRCSPLGGYGAQIRWSADSRWIAYVRRVTAEHSELVIAPSSGGKPHVYRSARLLAFAWSPRRARLLIQDGRRLLTAATPRGRKRVVATGCSPVWDATGTRIAYTTGGWAHTVAWDGRDRRRVTPADTVEDWTRSDALLVTRQLYRARCLSRPEVDSYPHRVGRLFRWSFRTRRVRAMTGETFRWGDQTFERGTPMWASTSPRSSAIIFGESRPCLLSGAADWEPTTFLRDRSGRLRLVGYGIPRWSPSGRLFFAESLTTQRLSVYSAEGVQVAQFSGDDATWSPDGRRVAYRRWAGVTFEPFEIFTATADQENSETLLISDGEAPSWSPDGGRIAFLLRDHPRSCSGLRVFRLSDRSVLRIGSDYGC